jgi:hypothetical protein
MVKANISTYKGAAIYLAGVCLTKIYSQVPFCVGYLAS